jgi:hypothetical protein
MRLANVRIDVIHNLGVSNITLADTVSPDDHVELLFFL